MGISEFPKISLLAVYTSEHWDHHLLPDHNAKMEGSEYHTGMQ